MQTVEERLVEALERAEVAEATLGRACDHIDSLITLIRDVGRISENVRYTNDQIRSTIARDLR